MKIKLYTHKGCVNCIKVKAALQRILPEFGLLYTSSVSELDIDDADVLAELLMINAESVPVVMLGGSTLTGASVLDEGRIRNLVIANLSSLGQRPE
jgi:glutaredoxin